MKEQRIQCPKCRGRGERDHRPCQVCWGAGSLSREEWERAKLGEWPTNLVWLDSGKPVAGE